MSERRSQIRHKAFITGRIYFNNRLASLDCMIRDVTEEGCRLVASENVALPENFELYIPHKDEYFHAHVRWRRGDNIGVSWTPEYLPNSKAETGHTEFPLAERVAKLEHQVAALQRRLDALRQS